MVQTCIIIEDQPPAQRILQKYIQDIGSLELKETFNDAMSALPYLQQHPVDLIFLDIHLPKLSGMEFLKTLSDPPQVILTTAFSEYALESYEYNVADYLLKPFSFLRFVQAVNKTLPLSRHSETGTKIVPEAMKQSFFIKSGYDLIRVESSNILFIQSDSDYTELITLDQKHLSSEPLKYWLSKLGEGFIQVHRSYLVNAARVTKVSGNQIYLEGGHVIPIGRAYKDLLRDFLQD
ncbi:response regulator transcription factor [bacterium SCSIO 12741]|nr:response regulator transcription factor [bacterium SCSIO 12741]